MNRPTYDVVIPTHQNRETKNKSLEIVLSALARAPQPPDRIIVVNNGEASTPNRRWLKVDLCPAHKAEYVEIKEANRAKARNAGAIRSSAQFLLFCDDDIVPSPEAVRLALARASDRHFCCGARRRFLSMGVARNQVSTLVEELKWAELDDLANDTRVPEAGWRTEFRGLQYHSSYIGCFGLVPRWAFDRVGGFNERFEGWGLEDTELMRRLLGVVGFRSLIQSTVWHLDHLVSPYIWEEHWGRNLRLYCDRQREKPLLELCRLFSRDSCEAGDPNVLVPPPKEPNRRRALKKLPLQPEVVQVLEDYLDKAEQDENVAAVILFGSALRSSRPDDVDLDRIVFLGDTACRKVRVRNVPIDEHLVRMSAIRNTLHKPFFHPETWPWIACRYSAGIYLHQKVDLERIIKNDLSDIVHRSALHLVTFHLGRTLQAASRVHMADRLEGLKHVAVLGCLSEGTFPDRMRYPYSGEERTRKLVTAVEDVLHRDAPVRRRGAVLRALEKIVARIVNEHNLQVRVGSIFYGASVIGLEGLQEVGFGELQACWGNITNDDSISEKIVHLYGFVQSEGELPVCSDRSGRRSENLRPAHQTELQAPA